MAENDSTRIKITWLPNLIANSGSNFFVKYRLKGKTEWSQTDLVIDQDFVIMNGFMKNKIYEIMTISVDGSFMAESSIQDVANEKSGENFHGFLLERKYSLS